METARKIAAVIVGIFILVLIVLAARWVGEQIRERFFTPKPVVVTTPAPTLPVTPTPITEIPGATPSAIPSTGPNDLGYLAMSLMLFGGSSLILLTKRTS